MSQKLVVALDVNTVLEAENIIAETRTMHVKIGQQLLAHPDAVAFAAKLVRSGYWVMYDAKLYDIPETVFRATHQIATRVKPHVITVALYPGAAQMAVKGTASRIAHVPSLTTDPSVTEPPLQYGSAVVCRHSFAEHYSKTCGIVICPGGRLPGHFYDGHVDTKISPFATHVVIGRPIYEAANRALAYEEYKLSLNQGIHDGAIGMDWS